MDFKLFNAILSMDSYNRGYQAGIVFGDNPGTNNYSSDIPGVQIGTAKIVDNSSAVFEGADDDIGFYALSYDVGGAGTIISYRGTDDALDVAHGWPLGGIGASAQGQMAIDFYNGDMT
ncbi:MAG: hypothetical protein ACRBDL_11795 [Alphaproteobacteria bacterium]